MTIITAFYELDLQTTTQESYKAKRTVSDYLNYFSFFAGVKNDMVIYTNCDIQNDILALRESHGLGDKTMIIKKPLSDFASDDYEKIKAVFKRYNQALDRFDPTHPPHTSPNYVYLMYLKSFFVCDYVKNYALDSSVNNGTWGGGESSNAIKGDRESSNDIAWLDFGYNFNGHQFIDSSQFCITLTPNKCLDSNKINLFSLGAISSATLAHILCNGTSHFLAGGLLYGGSAAWVEFNGLMKLALNAFVSFNILDDDQKLYLWVVRNYPNKCNVLPIDGWFNALFYFIPDSFRDSIKVNQKSALQTADIQSTNFSATIANPPFKTPMPRNLPLNSINSKSFGAKEVKVAFRYFKKVIKGLLK